MAIANISGNILTDSGVATSSLLPLSGGTLTGALSGTSATFSSSVQAASMSIGIAPQTDKLFVYNASGTNTGLTIQQDGTGDIFRANGNSGANRFVVQQGGNVGIGTTSPSGAAGLALAINGGASQTRIALKNSTTGDAAGNGFQILLDSGSVDAAIENRENGHLRFATGGTERMRITSGGDICINTTSSGGYKLNVNGSTSFGSAYVGSLGTGLVYSSSGTLTSTNPSDSRLKENIADISWGLSDILKLRPVSYHWKNDKINQGVQFGFIAQEVQEVMPEAIKEFGEDVKYLGLEKDAIYAALVNAIKELKAEIDELKNK